MIDAHCHVDLFPDPTAIANECERLGIYTIAMTNLPSHFKIGFPHLKNFRKVRLALGLHPLYATRHKDEYEIFDEMIDKTSYIGEIGLDYSNEGISTKSLQLESFHRVLKAVTNKKKVLSLHSRNAENDTFKFVAQYDIQNAIFHWYTGPVNLIKEIASEGYYFSINPAMIRSIKGQEIISNIPPSNVLTESDGPFIKYNNRPLKPADLGILTEYLATAWDISEAEVTKKIRDNFKKIISQLAT